ncbi:MAG: hypothetical protein A4E66_00852 [Syntrophus sp. PtaB.Bin001]|nr:MAG: hypothetical protein A4E66_00852 [Syntrophus sp. PtaB.Bin001]
MRIAQRLNKLEQAAMTGNRIPQRDRVLHFTYRNGDQADYLRKRQECLDEFQAKYGPDAPMDDIVMVAIRKFYRD